MPGRGAGETPRPAYAHTARGTIHYAEAGQGEPLLLLHATPGTHRAFRYLQPLLARAFRTIAVDSPGYGGSDAVAGPLTIESLAASVVALLDALSLPRAHVLGLHTGNKIAAAMAADFPARVDRVVLAGQTHSLVVDRQVRDDAIRALVDHYFPRFRASGDGTDEARRWLMAQVDVQNLWWSQSLLTAARVDPKEVEIAESLVIDHLLGWRSIVPTYEAVFAFDLTDAMRRMEAPTLVLELLTAEEAHFGSQAPRICEIMRHARGTSLRDTDASAFRMHPDRIAEAILPFLRER